MNIAIFGGSFNPPHLGHREVARTISEKFQPDKILIIPDNIPPHKEMDDESPSAEQRLEMCKLNFQDIPNVVVSNMEILREGKSYTADTIKELRTIYPDDKIYFAMGTDMLLSFEQWYNFRYLLKEMTLVVLQRNIGDSTSILEHAEYMKEQYDAQIIFVDVEPLPMSSTDIRELLGRRSGSSYLQDDVYEYIIKNRLYSASADLYWLRGKAYEMLKPKRVAHVAGVESEAVLLANKWGEDPENAAEAGILHDITKKLDKDAQLMLCSKYGIILENDLENSPQLLHAITGAEVAKDRFGVCEEVYNAIRWHTTGKPDMSLLEKIIYLADFIEPNREFEGVEELRELAYEDIDKAMEQALKMSIEFIRSKGNEPYHITADAYEWYRRKE